MAVPANDSSVDCADAKPGTSFELRSLYIPETETLDTFATAWATSVLTFPLPSVQERSGGDTIAVPNETMNNAFFCTDF